MSLPRFENFIHLACMMIFFLATAGRLSNAWAGHYPVPISTNTWSDYLGTFRINGEDAQPGDEVAFFDPQGVLCGLFVVKDSGQYGFLHVYGDDLTSLNVDEGARLEDVLIVRVWDASAGLEYFGTNVVLSPGNIEPPSPQIPPVWVSGGQFSLNIDTTTHFGDIDNNGKLGLSDALLALQIVSGGQYQGAVPPGVDVNSDNRIGLQEVVYILQELAGLRGQ